MASIGWLHVTDLHVGQHEQGRLWSNVRDPFYRDLQRLHKKSGPWDIVFFTGDLTQGFTPEEFKKLDRTLDDLWEQFRALGSSPLLLAVPGNHDLTWPNTGDQSLEPILEGLRDWTSKASVRENFWKKGSPYRHVVEASFDPFTAWYQKWRENWRLRHPEAAQGYRSWRKGILPGDFSITIEKDGIRLGVIGLNTAFLQLAAGDYRGRLAVDIGQLLEVCDPDPGKWCQAHHAAVLLTHHPADWLWNQVDFETDIASAGRFLMHFFGHMHEPSLQYIRIGGSETVRKVQGRSLFGLEKIGNTVQRLHGYSAGRLEVMELDTERPKGDLRIWPRIVKLRERIGYHAAPDWDNFELDEHESIKESVEIRPLERSNAALNVLGCIESLDARQWLRICRQIANETRVDELAVARLRVELELLTHPAKGAAAGAERDVEDPVVAELRALAEGLGEARRTPPNAGSTPPPFIEVDTSFELTRAREDIGKYFSVLEAMFRDCPQEIRFLTRVRVKDGFLAPIHLLSGLLDRFDQDWTPVLRAFGHSLTDGHRAEWQTLQSFIFDCWLLWGPSIPLCTCDLWRNTAGEACGVALQYGYGDESNSIPVYVDRARRDAVIARTWAEGGAVAPTAPGAQRGLARRASLTGTLVSGAGLPRDALPVAQNALLQETIHTGADHDDEYKYRIIVEHEDHDVTASESGADYYSAYVWIMFEVLKDGVLPEGGRWLGLLPFFEHTNIAHGDTYDFMKDQLARKALSFIARYAPQSIRFRYACAFDDPGHAAPATASPAPSIRDKVRELLRHEEFARLEEHVELTPAEEPLPACRLPVVVEEFYGHVSGYVSGSVGAQAARPAS